MGCHFLLQGLFSTQGFKPASLALQVDSLPLSHQGSPKMDSEPGKVRRLMRGNPDMFHMSGLNCQEARTLSLSQFMCAYSHLLSPLLINISLVSLFHLFLPLCRNSLPPSRQARVLSLATGLHGLVARIPCSHCHGLASISDSGGN